MVSTRNRLAASRVYQALSRLVAAVRGDGAAPPAATGSGHVSSLTAKSGAADPLLAPKRRVGPEDFEADLREIVDIKEKEANHENR